MDRIREQQTKAHHARVRKYYDITQRFYKWFWHGETLGLHYGFWESGVRNRKQAILKENEVLAKKAGINKGDLVLDAGCGIGGSGIWLTRERGATVYGLNLVHSQLLTAKELAAKRGLVSKLGYVQGDYQRLPIRDSSLDVSLYLESIEHATNPAEIISEAYRTLKPGGRMVVAGTFRGRYDLTVQESKQLEVGMLVAGCFNDLKTADDIAQVMEDSGFIGIENTDKKKEIMKSARQMTIMCRLGLPIARLLADLNSVPAIARILKDLNLVPSILVLNNKWGTYQEELFRSGATSYNVLATTKP